MPLDLPVAKGLAEAIQPVVRFPTLLRAVLPGALAIALCEPATALWSRSLSANLPDDWHVLVLLLGAVVLAGWFVSSLNDPIYRIYEGRLAWPRRLSDGLKAHHAGRIESLRQRAEQERAAGRNLAYDETWNRLRRYPMDAEGSPYASHPTLLGNILAEYETYPETRHGMDAVFYFPRLWLQLDKDRKEEIDGAWAVADGLLALSGISVVGGVVYVAMGLLLAVTTLVSWVPVLLTTTAAPFGLDVSGSPSNWCVAGLALVAAGYTLYRMSLPFHQRNGTAFKAVFDLYRHTLADMTQLGPAEIASWQGTWAYLQYLRIHCHHCKDYFPADKELCTHCRYPAAASLANIRQASRPPAAGQEGNCAGS